jgi:hypothetical protein
VAAGIFFGLLIAVLVWTWACWACWAWAKLLFGLLFGLGLVVQQNLVGLLLIYQVL